MVTIIYRVQLKATCMQNSTCPEARHEVADQTSPEVIHEQVKFMKTRVFCVNCGAPNRFTTDILPQIAPWPTKTA